MPPSSWRATAGAQFEPEKTPVTSTRGVVAANHPLGSAAGLDMLAMGGNAIDAAVATLFTLNVVEPMMVGIFGAGWTHIRLADGSHMILDNYTAAPAAATPDLYTPISDTWPDYMETEGRKNRVGFLATGVPGTLKAWAELVETWGQLDLETVMQPAIRHAERGFRASAYLCELIQDNQADLALDPDGAARIFLPGGEPPRAGDLIRQPELADSLRTIASAGPDVMYGGALGQTIVAGIQRQGGILTIDDLITYRTIRRSPLMASYRGYDITVPEPPCSGGLHVLQILRILEGYPVAKLGFGTVDAIHLLAECFKIAFTDRAAHVGDPATMDIPVDWLMSSAYAAERRAGIDMGRAAPLAAGVPPSVESATTTHVTTADGDGNIVAMTQTINNAFGAKVMAPGTGILLNNTMALFDPHPGHPNSVGPGKRVVSSVSPTIVTQDGAPFMALGLPGGVRIFPSVLQALVNVIDHGMTLQEAVEAPRVWTQGQELEVEDSISPSIRDALTARGHQVTAVTAVAGGMNGIQFDADTGVMTAAACWRADGSPAALGGGPARPGVRFRTTVRRDH
ncbi:MAG: gamma-glutamyltransferase [Candidatus Entotheonella factor]|uniref:Glutathione hydrolase proenzyme n=1 Tax=Entotheonella factor TaxID=1429438 RepID=W4LAY7_ENTF1|nr:MAG: gamma-glutamyltransferase [Candidatus Entotheonella factor]